MSNSIDRVMYGRIVARRGVFLCVAVVVAIACYFGHARGSTGYSTAEISSGMSIKDGKAHPALLLVAIAEGLSGESLLVEWTKYVGAFNSTSLPPPRLWILCPNAGIEASVHAMRSDVNTLVVDTEVSSWADVMTQFLSQSGSTQSSLVGLFGEGSSPNSDVNLAELQAMLQSVFYEAMGPMAVVSRSRGLRGKRLGIVPEEWLPDTFVSHVWCNPALIASDRLGDSALSREDIRGGPFLGMLPLLLFADKDLVLVDGTTAIRPRFAVQDSTPATVIGNDAAVITGTPLPGLAAPRASPGASYIFNETVIALPANSELRIGTLDLALVCETPKTPDGEDATTATTGHDCSIAKAPWPPHYLLETVATEDGLVVVSNVNCGYLDMAVNFLLSVRRTTGIKILFIAMDEIAFDYMDAMDPGCTTMLPYEGSERQHSTQAGKIGDDTFAAEVVVRPFILQSILSAGFTVLWTDSDMVWLTSPLPYLPDIRSPIAAEVMLQNDGNAGNKCTCFMFIKPTPQGKQLVQLWEKEIIETHARLNQPPLKPVIVKMLHEGLNLEIISSNVFPAGKEFFDHSYEQNYTATYHPETVIVHNNWIKGHEAKRKRFMNYNLWDVQGLLFPDCSG